LSDTTVLLDGLARTSPIVSVYNRLSIIHPNWYVEWGRRDKDGWIPGDAFANASEGAFHELLERIGARMRTSDRKIIAASFALRFGWSAGAAVAPFLLLRCVPDVRLGNVSLRFGASTLFEKVSLHHPWGVIIARENASEPRLIRVRGGRDLQSDSVPIESGTVAPELNSELQEILRATLVDQAQPVVDTLYAWSRFSKRAIWGQIASSWRAQFTSVLAHLNLHAEGLRRAQEFFDSPGFINGMRPKFYAVTHNSRTRIYHRRASCCLYYRLPTGSYCASCPLLTQAERVRRNKEWIERTTTQK